MTDGTIVPVHRAHGLVPALGDLGSPHSCAAGLNRLPNETVLPGYQHRGASEVTVQNSNRGLVRCRPIIGIVSGRPFRSALVRIHTGSP